ncbi:sulfurtransferase TusA family protein [Alphaproteobacteria bacterium]|nr:sulfurtransferase TusA family protein [Alphaproteobacteria bacterium]
MPIDATGLNCPLPVLRLQKALRDIEVGGQLYLHATDKMAVIDVPHFCSQNGHSLTSTQTQKAAGPGGMDLLIFEVVKGEPRNIEGLAP